MPAKRIVLLDDHPVFRDGLAYAIERQSDLEVSGQAATGDELMAFLQQETVDLVTLDITLGGKTGIDVLRDLRTLHPDLPALVVSMHDERLYAERAIRAGARGYVMKEAGAGVLVEAIRKVLAGHVALSQRMSDQLVFQATRPADKKEESPISVLTPREFEVFTLVGQGKNGPTIARELGLSVKTIDVHRTRIRKKLNLSSGTALTQFAIRWNNHSG